ncbi:hypothetical protein [Pseudomonas sp.]|uniref:hypothetical protein n=1 Tax=Pseudomonas sp. TaxID=306 RepID=UPI003D6E03E1
MYDPFLKSLNEIVNKHDISFGVTLVVAGGVISGTLVSAKSFIDGFADSFSSAWPGGPNESVRAGLEAWGQPAAESIHEEFVHLKGARYVFGKDFAPNVGGGMLWRGSLESISGFSLGGLNQA